MFSFHRIAVLAGSLAVAASAFSQTAMPDEIDNYLASLMKNVQVVKTARNKHGEDISCVDIDHQPAMNDPRWVGPVHRQLSTLGQALFPGVIVPAPPSSLCPEGSVEMHLPTRERIVAAHGLRSFLSKHPDGSYAFPPQSQLENLPGHYYATTQQTGAFNAGQTGVTVWNPGNVGSGQFSLSQIWISGGSGPTLQTVEAGVMSYPDRFVGDKRMHMFVYFTANGYNGTGCYDVCSGGFVQISSVLPVGGVVSESTPGNIISGVVAWYLDPWSGDWYLYQVNPDGTYTASGYYPGTLFQGGQMAMYATAVTVGGEVWDTKNGSKPKVGMGNLSNAQTFNYYGYYGYPEPAPKAAHFQVKVETLNGVISDFKPNTTDLETPIGVNAILFRGCAYGARSYAPDTETGVTGSGAAFVFGGRGYTNYYSGCS